MENAVKKGMKFTIELDGFELPENIQEEISQELNKIVMEKIGSLDLGKNSALPRSTYGLVFWKNGGKFLRLNDVLSKTIRTNVFDKINVKDAIGAQVFTGI